MKKLLPFCLLFLSLAAARAQSYVPFPTTHTLWTERHAVSEVMVDYRCYGLRDKDTLIGGQTYHQLFLSADSVLEDSEYCGALREEDKQIYYYAAGAGAEKLLYDFSVKTGDTVQPASVGMKAIVASEDSISIAGTYRRQLHFKTLDGTEWKAGTWIEGIGNSAFGGLLGSVMMVPTCDCGSKLICVKEDEVYIYHNPGMSATDCFGPGLEIPEIMTRESVSSFIPNPVHDKAVLNNAGYTRITLVTVTGQQYYSADIQGQHTVTLDKADFPSGIYFFRLAGGSMPPFSGKVVME